MTLAFQLTWRFSSYDPKRYINVIISIIIIIIIIIIFKPTSTNY